MQLDPTTANRSTYWVMPEDRTRVFVDERGTEWDVYDESVWTLDIALEWDFLPQTDNPGLIFASRLGRKRLWPCPADWRDLGDQQLGELLSKAKTII